MQYFNFVFFLLYNILGLFHFVLHQKKKNPNKRIDMQNSVLKSAATWYFLKISQN